MLIKFDLPKDPGETQNMLNETTNLRSLLLFCVNYIECHLQKSSSLIPPTTEWITPSNPQATTWTRTSTLFSSASGSWGVSFRPVVVVYEMGVGF